jgi:hypothetical protein
MLVANFRQTRSMTGFAIQLLTASEESSSTSTVTGDGFYDEPGE